MSGTQQTHLLNNSGKLSKINSYILTLIGMLKNIYLYDQSLVNNCRNETLLHISFIFSVTDFVSSSKIV